MFLLSLGASVILVCMSSKYQTSENCTRECQYGQDRKKGIIPIKLESGFNATGALGLITAGRLYIDFSDSSKFNDNMRGLKREIEAQVGRMQVQGLMENSYLQLNKPFLPMGVPAYSLKISCTFGKILFLSREMFEKCLKTLLFR